MAYNHLPRKRPLFNTKKVDKPKRPSFLKRTGYVVKKALTRTCIFLGAMMIISSMISITLSTVLLNKEPEKLPEQMVLVYKIEGGINEIPPKVSFTSPLEKQQALLPEILKGLELASADDRVKAVVFSLSRATLNLGTIQELRPAIKRIKDAGKATIVYSDTYASGPDFGRYYLASTFDEIWMQPVGMVNFSGLNVQMPFLKTALGQIGVKGDFIKRKEYKSAMEMFTEDQMTPAAEENMRSLIGDLYSQITETVAFERGRSVEEIQKIIEKGLYIDEEAVEVGLVDQLGYGDEVIDEMKERITGDRESKDLEFVMLPNYAKAALYEQKRNMPPMTEKKSQVALVNVFGAIVPGKTQAGYQAAPLGMSGDMAGATTISSAIYDAADDKNIEAIIVRISSPGGSPVASETIRRSILKAKEKGKKVIVSMGDVAASGGYWIAADADRVLALPATITGSIGTVGGKYDFSGLWDKVGVKWDGFQIGQNSGIWSFNQGFTPSERERMNAMMDDIYLKFTTIVSKGRGLSAEQVEEVARGRAWTGQQALEIGLIDELGGLEEAYQATAKILGKPDKEALTITVMPKQKTPVEQILELLSQQAMAGAYGVQIMEAVETTIGPMNVQLDRLQSPQNYMVYEPISVQ